MSEIKTKVCKVCGEEKLISEFHKREKGYYRTECKVCAHIKKHKLESNEKWSLDKYRIILDVLINNKIKYINELELLLDKSLKDIVLLFIDTIKIGNIPINIIYICDNCGEDIILKPFEFLEEHLKFCTIQCSADYNKRNNTWGRKSKDLPDWCTDIDEFINNYKIFGLYETAKLYNKNIGTITYWANKYNLTREKMVSELTDSNVIYIYNLVLEGKLTGFPNGFTKYQQYKTILLKYLFKNILKWNRDDICNNYTIDILKQYKLDSIILNNENREIIKEIYPDIKMWEFKRFSNFHYSFWNDDNNVQDALKWFKEKLYVDKNISNINDLQKFNYNQLLHEYNLHSLCIKRFNRESIRLFSIIFETEAKHSDIVVYNKCIECGETKEFTNEYFPKGNPFSLFNLKNICLECMQKRESKYLYKSKCIFYDNITDISPEQWWEYYYDNKITMMPQHCYNQNNYVKIVRYIVLDKLKYQNKNDICLYVNCPNMQNYKIFVTHRFGTLLNMLQKCFPEYNIGENDLCKYDDLTTIEIIENWMNDNNISVEKILNSYGISGLFNKDMKNLYQSKQRSDNYSVMDLFILYFNKKNILHPKTNNSIIDLDFINKTDGFWEDKNNRIRAIKYYCENQCEENILNNMDTYSNLREWVLKYFTKVKLKPLYYFNTFKINTFDLLVEVYPIIKENKLLFSWELARNSNTSVNNLINILREFVKYRMNDLVIDIKHDLPIYLNFSYMLELYPKFCAYLQDNNGRKRKFSSFYEWACLAFPEYSQEWKSEDFGICIAYDGAKCNSKEEIMVYEYIKRNMNIDGIFAVGMVHNGKYVYKYNGINKLCPDFIIEHHKNIKLTKPIIIEYYGLFQENYSGDKPMLVNYHNKINIKNNFYNSRNDIIFIDLYPDDLKNNFEGVRKKLLNIINSINLVA